MNEILNIDNNIIELVNKCEKELSNEFSKIDEIVMYNSTKVLNAFVNNRVSTEHFNGSTGYGYGDMGREVIEKIYSDIFKAESALVRGQFISGTHALTVCLFALLRPNDTLLSITGKPYDTLDEVIGIKENVSSLKSFGVNYEQIDLVDNDFDYDKIKELLTAKKIKVIEMVVEVTEECSSVISLHL